jgi:hypothetical protein
MPRTERRVSSFGQPSWSYFRGDTSFENTTRTLRRPSAASMASTMDLDPGEGCLDLAKVAGESWTLTASMFSRR